MGNYRTTVILKTDIVDSTPRLAEQTQTEMGSQRKQHKRFITNSAVKHSGAVFQEEGDAYLIEFPSVTDAVLAAIDMHQTLRSLQTGKSDKKRLAIRAVITVGDILHQETDSIGMAMSLTARIEKITPPDEIYLSHAAWMILNKAEVQTSFVNEFQFKGFGEPEKIYKVEQKHGIQMITDQCIVFADAKGFSKFVRRSQAKDIESFLVEYDGLINEICDGYGGVIRQVNGDLYFITFEKVDKTISAMRSLGQKWKSILEKYDVGISIGVHKGNLSHFRSYVFGDDINTTMQLSELSIYCIPDYHIFVALSSKVKGEFQEQDADFEKLDNEQITNDTLKKFVHEQGAYRLIVE